MAKRILVVDDDAMNLRMAEFMLAQGGYEVLKAESGEECLSVLKSQKTDLILLDIEMPLMNGFKTLEKIKENKELADIPVLFLTASSDVDKLLEEKKAEVCGYIKKPFLPQVLLEKVEAVIC